MTKIIKIVIAVGVLIILVGGGFFAWQKGWLSKIPFLQAIKNQNETADWQTYTNNQYGFEIKYPSDWKYYKQSGEDVRIIDFCGPEYWTEKGDCLMAGKGSTAAITLRNDSLDIKKEGFCTEQSLNIFCGDILNHKNISIEGRSGEIFEFNYNNGYMVALWKKNLSDERMYELSVDELNDLPGHRDIFNQMLSTLKFIEAIGEKTPFIKVLAPNGGEEWAIGERHDIRWEAENLPLNAKVLVRIKRDDGGVIGIANDVLPQQTEYQWQIDSNKLLCWSWGASCAEQNFVEVLEHKFKIETVAYWLNPEDNRYNITITDGSDSYFSVTKK